MTCTTMTAIRIAAKIIDPLPPGVGKSCSEALANMAPLMDYCATQDTSWGEAEAVWLVARMLREVAVLGGAKDPWPWPQSKSSCGRPTQKGRACRSRVGLGKSACARHMTQHDWEDYRAWQDAIHYPHSRLDVAPGIVRTNRTLSPQILQDIQDVMELTK